MDKQQVCNDQRQMSVRVLHFALPSSTHRFVRRPRTGTRSHLLIQDPVPRRPGGALPSYTPDDISHRGGGLPVSCMAFTDLVSWYLCGELDDFSHFARVLVLIARSINHPTAQ